MLICLGQHNDARMNLSIIITAARMGANVANHVAVTKLLKSKDAEGKEKVCGARVKDMLTGQFIFSAAYLYIKQHFVVTE